MKSTWLFGKGTNSRYARGDTGGALEMQQSFGHWALITSA